MALAGSLVSTVLERELDQAEPWWVIPALERVAARMRLEVDVAGLARLVDMSDEELVLLARGEMTGG